MIFVVKLTFWTVIISVRDIIIVKNINVVRYKIGSTVEHEIIERDSEEIRGVKEGGDLRVQTPPQPIREEEIIRPLEVH